MSVSWFTVPTPLPSGPVRVGITTEGVVSASFGDPAKSGDTVRPADEPRAALVAQRFAEFFAGTRRDFDLPIDWRGTAAGPQRDVLQCLQRTVGYGSTIAYGELAVCSGVFDTEIAAGQLGQAARAVGSIMGSNPVFMLVPCHRVVAAGGGREAPRTGVVVGRRAGGIGGFGGGPLGMEVKRWLLTLEGVLAPTFDWNGPG